MKIALFIPDLFGGGAQRMIVNMAATFAQNGHDMDLVLGRKEGIYEKLIPDNVTVIDFGKKRITGTLFPLVRYIKTAKPDILLSAMTHTNIFAIAAKLLSPGTSTKFVVSERNHFTTRTQNSASKHEGIYTFLMPYFYAHADAIVGISKGVASDLKNVTNIPQAKIKAIYNPVVTPEMLEELEDPTPHPEIEDWIKKEDTPVIVTSGRFVPQKDHRTLLQAFAHSQKKIESRLLLLSEGALKDDLKTQARTLGIEDKIHFAGFVDHPLSVMRLADLFVLSSRWEGFGNVLVEALLCGLPIVSTDCPSGPAEILDDGKYGTLVPVQDAEALSAAITDTLQIETDCAFQKRRALEFTAEKICADYEALFRKLQETRS